jgi:hypothetical protein
LGSAAVYGDFSTGSQPLDSWVFMWAVFHHAVHVHLITELKEYLFENSIIVQMAPPATIIKNTPGESDILSEGQTPPIHSRCQIIRVMAI